MFGFVRLRSPGAAFSGDEAGRGLDLPGSAGDHHGPGQLDHGLRQCKEPAR